MIRLAVTGNIACGKNLVGEFLGELGCPLIDSDLIVHEILATENSITTELVKLCAPHNIVSSKRDSALSMQQGSGFIDRRALGNLLFNQPSLKAQVEQVIHPPCFKRINEFFETQENLKFSVAANLIPLLYETKTEHDYGAVWLVYCDEVEQLRRLKLRNPELEEVHLLKRIRSQMPQSEKLTKNPTCIIDNSFTRESTKEQVIIAWKKLNEQSANQ